MRHGCRHKLFRPIKRFGRRFVPCALVPVLLVSSAATQAILIHDHHGHDTHSHALSVHQLDELRSNSEHLHEEHEHDEPAVDFADGEGSSLVILMALPEGLARGRVLSSSAFAGAGNRGGPRTNVVAIVTHHSHRTFTTAVPSSIAPPVRAHSVLEGILLTSHALLL